MISDKHKTIFVHIPKAGGQSVETMFLNEFGLNWEERSKLLLRKKEKHEEGPQRLAHLRARDYISLGFIKESLFDSYFKFSIVRNPYKRVFSLYNFLGYSKVISLRTFVCEILLEKVRSDHYFFRSQYDYLYDTEGKLLVDFIGKLENIETDIKEVVKKAGIKNSNLPHVNKSKGEWKRAMGLLVRTPGLLKDISILSKTGKSYDTGFTKELKDMVYTLYINDFKYLGYER
jgi:hypothetical protein